MENYTKFTIQNFRCFSTVQTLSFAQPKSDKLGSGITYIVGANNSGKTTLIESMCLKTDDYLNESEKRTKSPEFNYYKNENLVRTVKLLRENSSCLKENPERKHNDRNELFEIIASRRHWSTNSGNDNRTSRQIIDSSTVSTNPRKQQSVPVASILRNIESNDEKYEDFTKLVKRIFPEFHEWSVGYENQHYIKYTSQDGINHTSDFLGDGVISVIRILAHLFDKGTSGLIIDEPELSLHPLAQKKLIKVIAEYAQNRQIIISTHSPYFISWEYIRNGAVLNRVAKESQTNSRIHTLSKYEDYEKLINGANWQQPFLMDIVSNEIFFQDNILFVEGQEDVGLLQSQFIDTDINLFGYGVRGCDNFKVSLKLAKDLGIKKACVLIDSPYSSSTDKNENRIKEELEKEYKCLGYEIIQWNKSDIRDKPDNSLAKEGYFAKDGKLKPTEELEDFHEKIKNIVDYFSSKEKS